MVRFFLNYFAIRFICTTFVSRMKNEIKETFNIRVVSCAFIVLALVVFKPFGLENWQWQAWVHLLAIFALGICSCIVTEACMKYIFRMPHSTERGVSYIIRRNLWFQCINTPLVALLICLYRHFLMNDLEDSNKLSWSNYLETLVIVAFLSFAIGLYWRFKFRSRYLSIELEETRELNEQLKKVQEQKQAIKNTESKEENHEPVQDQTSCPPDSFTLTGTTNESITLNISDLLYIESVGNYVKVLQQLEGQVHTEMIRATMKQIEDELQPYPMIVRCHRAFLVNLAQVEQIVSRTGSLQLIIRHSHDAIPVSRSNIAQVKETINRL